MALEDNALRLAAVDDVAASEGARRGQNVADALALWPELKLYDADFAADADALAGLARWCLRFSPAIAIDAPDGVFLDIAGCAHLWGGEEGMAHALRDKLAAQNIPARIGVADTFGAAWALAHFSSRDIEIAGADMRARLTKLPVVALRVEAQVSAQLKRLGLKTIGQVATLPRASLCKRFGADLLRQLARAFGEEDEALTFLQPPRLWLERRVFAEPLTRAEDFQRVVRDLAAALCARLDEAGLGARRFEAAFHRVDGETAWRDAAMALPARDPKRLGDLFAPKLETIDPGFGVEVITLAAESAEPLSTAQCDLVEMTADARNADLAPLIDRLRNQLGHDRVWRAAPYPSHAPERAVERIAPLAAPRGESWGEDQPRPLRLFRRPEPIEAMAPVPDDPPVMFRWRGQTHRVRRAEGPERIAAEWWRKAWEDNDVARVRDYYRVEDESGARFWVFRAGLYGGEEPTRWFVHGLFA